MSDYNDARAKALDAARRAFAMATGPRVADDWSVALAAYDANLAAAGWVRVPIELLTELADDLAAHIDAQYQGTSHYPSMERKRLRDMEPVERVRAMLAARPGAEVKP